MATPGKGCGDDCGGENRAARLDRGEAAPSVIAIHFDAANSTVTNLAAFFPTFVSVCVYPPGSHFTAPDLNCPGMGPIPSTSLRMSRSLTATRRCGPS